MASISDKITKTMQGSNPNVARVVSPRAAGSDTLQVDSLSGWNEDTATHFMSYRVDSAGKVVAGSQRDWKGIANKATGQIISLSLQAGAVDDGNLVGDIIQAGPTASWANDLAGAILETRNADGTLKDHIIEDKNIAKKSITAESIKDGSITANKIDLTSLPAHSYSTQEVDTGRKWIDGKTIYKKTITEVAPAVTANSEQAYSVKDIKEFHNIISVSGYVRPSEKDDVTNGTFIIPNGYAQNRGATSFAVWGTHPNAALWIYFSGNGSRRLITLTVEYTKD